MLKILLTATSLIPAYGGPAFSVSRLATALVTEGANVALWAADGSAVDTELLPESSSVRRLSGRADEAFIADRFDIVHDNGIWLPHNHRVARLAVRMGLPRIVSTRGMLEPWALRHKKWRKKLAWRLYQRRDLVSARCCHAATRVEAGNIERLQLGIPIREIPNGMDIPDGAEFARNPDATARIRTALFLGRIYPVKGLPMLVEAWSRVRPMGWRLLIAGPDEAGHRAVVERAIAAVGLGESIAFAGELHGTAKLQAYMDADLFILPSFSESFGMAIAEALAHGIPVLTTKGAPWPQLLQRRCGWWTEASADGIAAALQEATSMDTHLLRQMGNRGKLLIQEQFGWGRIARQMLSTYARVLTNSIEPIDVFSPVVAKETHP